MPRKPKWDTTKLFVAAVITIVIVVLVIWPLISAAGRYIGTTPVLPVERADLTITSASYNSSANTLTANVKNQGTAKAYNFTVNFRDVTYNITIANAGVWSLAAGSSIAVAVPSNMASGSHSIRITADSLNAVAESNEANNVYTLNVTVSAISAGIRTTVAGQQQIGPLSCVCLGCPGGECPWWAE